MFDKAPTLLFIIPDFFFMEGLQKKLYHNDIPIGTLQLLSYLKKELNIITDIIDFRMEIKEDLNNNANNPNNDKLRNLIVKILEKNNIQEYQNLGISCYTSFQYLFTEFLAKIIKEEFANKKIIVGGYHPTAVPGDFTYQNAPYDFIIKGESEIILSDLLSHKILNKKKSGLPQILNSEQLVDVNFLPFPDYELYLAKYPFKDKFNFDMYISRGCPYQCAFCADNYDFRSYSFETFRSHFDKLTLIVERTNKRLYKIAFADQSFDNVLINKKVIDYILEKGLQEKFVYSCQSRVETLANDMELLTKLLSCNFIIGYGFETLNKNMLLEMHKTEHPSRYLDLMEKIINIYENIDGPYGRLNFISGFPGENQTSFKKTIDFIHEHALHENIQISPSLFSNYPNLFVYRNMNYYEKKYGTKFEKEWWLTLSNPFKKSVPSPSSDYDLKSLLFDYKEEYMVILNHFRKNKPGIFIDLVFWKSFFNKWYEELN